LHYPKIIFQEDKVVWHTFLGIVVVLKKVIFWWNLKPATDTCSWISCRRCFRIDLLTLLILTFVDSWSNIRIFLIFIIHLVNFFTVIRKRLTCLEDSRVSLCYLCKYAVIILDHVIFLLSWDAEWDDKVTLIFSFVWCCCFLFFFIDSVY